jgi:hypothetical protein
MFEQIFRGKSGFETRTKTRKLNKESHDCLLSLSLIGCIRSSSVSSPMIGSVSISQIQSVLSVLFTSLGYFYIIFNKSRSLWHQRKVTRGEEIVISTIE